MALAVVADVVAQVRPVAERFGNSKVAKFAAGVHAAGTHAAGAICVG